MLILITMTLGLWLTLSLRRLSRNLQHITVGFAFLSNYLPQVALIARPFDHPIPRGEQKKSGNY